MKKYFLPLALLLVSSSAFADVIPCIPGTLNDYVNLGFEGCSVGGLTLQSFELWFGPNFSTPIDPALVNITPSVTAGTASLLLTLNSSAGTGDVFDLSFFFLVTGATLQDSAITLGDPTATLDAAVTGILDVCSDDPFFFPGFCFGSEQTVVAFAISDDQLLSDGVHFPPSQSFGVFVDLTIDGGTAGTAGLASAKIDIAGPEAVAVPEPSTAVLLASAIAALCVVQARRHRC